MATKKQKEIVDGVRTKIHALKIHTHPVTLFLQLLCTVYHLPIVCSNILATSELNVIYVSTLMI